MHYSLSHALGGLNDSLRNDKTRCTSLSLRDIFAPMKPTLVFLFALVTHVCTMAQVVREATQYASTPTIQFEEQSISLNNGVQPAIKVAITGNEDSYSKHLKNWFTKTYGIEAKRSNGLTVLPLAVFSGWSADSLGVTYRIEKDADKCSLVLFAAKKNVYLSQKDNAAEIAAIHQALKGQIKEYYIVRYDEVIADQQKEYERQLKDVEKTEGKLAKLNEKIKDENESVSKANSDLQEVSLKKNEMDQEVKILHTTLQQDKKIQDQAQKEVDQQSAIIRDKETLYNSMYNEGTLASKEGKRVTKDLEKLRKSQVKLQDRLTDASNKKTKTENALLKKEEAQIKLDASINTLNARKAKHQSEADEARSDLDKTSNDLADEKREMEASLRALESLKNAKSGVPTL